MAITINGSLVIDETSGTQNADTGSAGNNDIADGGDVLPSEFDAVLLQENASSAGATGFAVSGATADNSMGTDLLTNLGPDVVNLAFTDSAGNPLNGTAAKFGPGDGDFLRTTDGQKIFLYTSTHDDNVVIGRDEDGAVVFAAYLDTHTAAAGDAGATGAKVWLVQYQPIQHGIAGATAADHDDARSLLDSLYVTVSSHSDFSLAGAPSGQNLFLMFGEADNGIPGDGIGDDNVAIVVTGKAPANQSTGASITTGDTVNTGQGGGTTTIGTNNQMVNPLEGLYFTFVKGANPNYTVPSLDQNEADVEANIDFQSLYNATAATFTVVQLQPPKAATLKISAYTTAYEPGAAFVDGLSDDSLGDIDQVKVTTTRKAGKTVVVEVWTFVDDDTGTPQTQDGITVTFLADGTMTIKGIEAGDKIDYQTSGTHNRVLIENVGTQTNYSASFDIGGFALVNSSTGTVALPLSFEDDGPSIDANAVAVPTLTTDDTDIEDTAGPTSFAGLFDAPDFGADGFKDSDDDDVQDADALTYALGVSAENGVDSGLVDTLSGKKIFLFLQGGVVNGRVGNASNLADAAGAVAFAISVDGSNGDVSLAQNRAIVHDDPNDPAETGASAAGLAAASLVTLTATATDGDGDTDSATRNIGDAFKFEDDGPSIDANATAVPTLTTDDTDIEDTAGPTSFAGLFDAPDFGADGFKDSDDDDVQDADALTYALGVSAENGVDSGLVDTLSGNKIYLYLEGGQVKGRVGLDDDGGADAAGAVVFTISVNGSGGVTLVQSRSVVHDDAADPVESGASAAGLAAASLVTLTATVTDGDGDTDSATRNIGDAFKFEDDGPSISANSEAVPTLTTDDTDIEDSDSASFAGLFDAPDFGADGFKDSDDDDVQDADALTYALGVSAENGVDSGLVDTLSGKKIFLFLQGGVVNGRVGNASNLADAAGAVAFAISVDVSNGDVSLAQNRAIVHDDPNDPAETGASAAGLAAASLVTLTATATDGDGDTDSATRNIGDAFKFEDDGPALAFGNLVGTGTTLAQTGYWTQDAGKDGLGTDGLDIALTGFTLVRPDSTTTAGTFVFAEDAGSPDGSGNYLFSGTLTGDFDDDAGTADTSVDFNLVAYADGHYELQLEDGFGSEITLDTADGALKAGGPDPVQTLVIPKPPATPITDVVFFSARVSATDADILTGIGLGATDPTEADLEGPPLASFIDPRAMNVSTSGIGVANNLFEGDADAAIGGTDESFVINPQILASSVEIFIDNSVQGYAYSKGELLYYKVFYENGSNSGDILVITDLGLTNKGQAASFVISGGGQLIDAVQLTMASGDVKIPHIVFTTATESLASDIKLDFTATLTDGDGDWATSDFSAALYANEAAGSTYDFILAGTANEQDAFNIDLASDKDAYQVTGFDTGTLRDKLVLLGPAPTSVAIDNTGTDAVVTILESGGQTTTVTVVGVDLLNTDIA